MHRRSRSASFAAAAAVSLGLWSGAPASAQVTVPPEALEFEDAEIFRPTTDGGDFITVYDSDALPTRDFHLGGYGDYAQNPIEIQFERSGDRFTRVVEQLGTIQLSGAYGIFRNLEVGTRLPFYVNSIEEVSTGQDSVGGTEANIGDIVLNAKYTLLSRRPNGVGFAVLPELTLPTGNRQEFQGTGKLGYGGLLILDFVPTPDLVIGANFGGLIRDQVGGGPFEDPDDDFNDQLRYGIAAKYRFHERYSGIAELYGGADTSSPFDEERKTPLDAIGALRIHFGPVDLTMGGGGGLTIGQGSPDFRLFVGVTTPKPDYLEKPGLADLSQSAKTYNVTDRDADGRTSPGDVLEYRINVVNTGQGEATDVHVEDPIPDRTRYVAGSLKIDGRPATDDAGDDGAEFTEGPPAMVTFRLPSVSAETGRNEAVLSFEVEIDRDITEITTIINQATASAAGVPQFPLPPTNTTVFPAIAEHEHVIVGPDKLELTEEIHFEFDKAVIRRESWPILKELGAVLNEYPDLRVRIEGHTDSVGSDSYNQRLSERRALAVRDFLIGLGIDKDRMEWTGYGESKPIASNDTAVGRAKNRRTEF
ncbi:MAG: OmpA family protein, partial [Candidatus Binatia bacterium]